MIDRPVLILDGMNVYMRAYLAYPQMSSQGYQMGGAVGFLKMMSRITAEIKPKMVCVAWEGGGSQRRRKLFKEYKMNRKPQKMNRFYEDDIPDSEDNKKYQLLTLLKFMKNVPACQLYASDAEGDDIVAYLSTGPLKDERKVIVSSDKDLYQLLDERTVQYSMSKKKCLTKDDIEKEFRVKIENFAIAKAMCGDAGDNITGVKGLGFKSLVKYFPIFGTDELTLQTVFDYAASHKGTKKVYERVLESEDKIRLNWKLVFLNGSMLSSKQTAKIDYVLETFKPRINKIELMKLMAKEGIDFDVNSFFLSFHGVEGLNYGS